MPTNLIADLVNKLFEGHLRPDGRQYSNAEVARTVGSIDSTYLSKLRQGKVNNPTRDTLLALCKFFNVPPTYFFPELNLSPETGEVKVHQFNVNADPEVAEDLKRILEALQDKRRNKDPEG